MSKLLLVLCIVFLAVSVIIACKPAGVPCLTDSDCCPLLGCNPWAGRCTKKIPVSPAGGAQPGMAGQ
ncbi:uncharacterized protein LOC117180201 [Belonocnema kinseyi]|uniref:uncharacterized protein LOC117180201 n=1 Tax=Belonocnema kinseyi TaxID=2817044 RepID=UPI00143D366F|nr:uncharacterized protein LOC117180201 [Belonocnema kinseyi]